jgi:hypothetical protein
MKTIKLQMTILTGLFMLLLIAFLLYPLLIILAIFMPYTFKDLLYKFMNTANLVRWLYEVADLKENQNEI